MAYKFTDIVIDSRTGLNPRKNFVLGNGSNYYITIKDIYADSIHFTDKTDRVDDEAIEIIKRRSRIKVGDVLFVSIGRIGETAIVTSKDDSWDVNESVFVFTLNDAIITPEYFCLLFRSHSVRRYLAGNSSGSTFKSIKMNQLERMTFDLPAIEEQKAITAKIYSARAIIGLRQQQLTELDDLVKARFVEMFGDPVLNPMGWETGTIRDVVSEVRYGTSRPAVEGGTYKYLRMGNITYDGHLDLSDLKYIDIPATEVEKCIVRKGDVLFNRTNSKELVGKTCVFDVDEPMIIAGYIIRVRINKRVLPIYLSSVLNSQYGKRTLADMCKAIVGQANINAQELQNIKLQIPPLTLQYEFSTFVTQVDKLKVVVQKALDEAHTLFDSLMQQYFG